MKAKKCGLKINEQKEELANITSISFPCTIYDNCLSMEEGNEIPWHWHDVIELVIVRSGSVKLCCNEESYILHEHEGAFINANVLHSAYPISACCVFDSLLFHPSLLGGNMESVYEQLYIQPLLQSSLHCVILQQGNKWQQEALSCIDRSFHAFEEEAFGHELYIRARLSDFWFLICKHCFQLKQQYNIKEDNDSTRIKEMINFIQEHYQSPISLADIAASVSISERECLRCFKKMLGIAPIQYLLKYRISIACKKLIESEDSITQISNEIGFDSPSYFTLMFKRFMSLTPRMYRHFKA